MPHMTNEKLLLIELRSGHSRHRFVRRHNTEHKSKRKHDRQSKPMRLLSWSLSIEAHSPKPEKRRSARTRSGTSSNAQSEARSETCCCCQGDSAAVCVIDDDSKSFNQSLTYVDNDYADSAAACSSQGGERKQRHRKRRHHSYHHYQHKYRHGLQDDATLLLHQHQHVYYRPVFDNSQVQNNYHRRLSNDDRVHRDAPNQPNVDSLLPDMQKMSLSNGDYGVDCEIDSVPPPYSDICPRSRDGWDDGRGGGSESVPDAPLTGGYTGFDMVEVGDR